MISVIIPIHNEEKVLSERGEIFSELAEKGELIFVDGESTDKGPVLASEYGRILEGDKGRALQMNLGARKAGGDILLFLHADTFISPDALINIERVVAEGYVGGCLTQRIDKNGKVFRAIESFGNIRSRITKVFYGDQGIFVKKDVFDEIGAFSEVPVMEDVVFSKRLRRRGKTKVLKDKITVSARRWEQRGVMKTVLLYSFLNVLFHFRVPFGKIKQYYDDLR